MDPRGFIAFVSIAIGTSPLVDAAALGLGDAELGSRLNEPLSVEIEVVGAPPQVNRLNATIGTESVRAGAGELSSQLRTKVSLDHGGRVHIRVTTERAVREPIVTFLLVVESAREHVMREYTLLLDPPGYSLPVIAAPEPVRPAVPEPAAAAPPPTEPKAPVHVRTIGPVARGETLSGLAMARGTEPGVTWAQMTWALFRMNPHAFIDGDINKLRSGTFLEMPSRDTMARWTHRQALDLIKAGPVPTQVAEASPSEPRMQSSPAAVAATPAASEPTGNTDSPQPGSSATATEPISEPPQALFRVLSPGDFDPVRSAGTVGSPASPRERERIQQLVAEANLQIQDSHEEIVKARKQLADTALQISSLVETVEQKDSEIRNLENRLSDLREFVKERSAAATGSDPNWLMRLLLEVLILAILVGVLAATLSRWNGVRRRPSDEAASGAIALELQMPTAGAAEAEVTKERPEEEQRTETADIEEPSPDHTEYEEIELRGDLLMEANAYLAYGYHEKAKEVLEEFIRENPADAEGRLVMLRTLHAMKEKRKFRRHAEALLELVGDKDDERWTEAARLGRAILPEERLFDANAHKRAEDEKWEQTVWTGTRASSTDDDDHTYLDIDEFKHVDLYLLDAEGTAPDDDPLDDPLDIPVGERVEDSIDFSLEDPTETFLDAPADIPTDIPADDKS